MKIFSISLLGTLLFFSANAQALYSLRCGTHLVSVGDHLVEALEKCGSPEYRDVYYAYEVYRTPRNTLPYQSELQLPVKIEEWIYNFGPHRFMYRLEFTNGQLRRIESLGRGHH